MINKLHNLYESYQPKFIEITQKFPDDDLAGPFLMSPNTNYQNQNTKILIVGQETNGWGYFSDNVKEGMKLYEKFNLGENYRSSPFWNVTRKVERALTGEEFSCAWTNLNKFDFGGKSPQGEHKKVISDVDDLLIQEIDLLDPDIVLFFTGPNFDNRIRNIFPEISYNEVEKFTERELALLKHPKLPANSYRTYHPRYLRQSRIEENFIKFVETIKI